MNNFFSTGDLIRLPQGVTLIRSKELGIVDDIFVLKKQEYGIYVKLVSEDLHEVIVQNSSWFAHETDIYERSLEC